MDEASSRYPLSFGGSSRVCNLPDEAAEPMSSIKRKLEQATGVPVEFQKVMLSSISELCMGDKRTNIKFGSCGTANGHVGIFDK